ncbi:hypothetical protein [Terrabacter sp. MAHUQ-38]|uniref:hypothetical protein n=1 Tax=unclassified Terrabacter TaxID=2630222 RepID=UPI00165E46DC|nr:hypothetical protein [Terrabacter sp. MAHUQ-38]MBC9822742.1 hypothetical protein [Terrabacter sp. MAHUQ-38]
MTGHLLGPLFGLACVISGGSPHSVQRALDSFKSFGVGLRGRRNASGRGWRDGVDLAVDDRRVDCQVPVRAVAPKSSDTLSNLEDGKQDTHQLGSTASQLPQRPGIHGGQPD